MDMFRSKSCREEITNKYHCFSNGIKTGASPSPTNQHPPGMLRSYSTSAYNPHRTPTTVKDNSNSKVKRGKSKNNNNNRVKKGLKGLCEAEIQRKRRVASYNVYGVEGRVKGSVRKSFKWFKDACSNAVYGLW